MKCLRRGQPVRGVRDGATGAVGAVAPQTGAVATGACRTQAS